MIRGIDEDLLQQTMKSALNSMGILHKKMQAACRALAGAGNVQLATTPYSVVYREDRIQVKHYHGSGTRQPGQRTPLMIVYALVNRETMLDLQPGFSVVQKLLNKGIDVYMIDWGYPSYNEKYLTIGDHVLGYMNNVVDVIRHRCRLTCINLMGICMGGTLAVMYAALHPQKVKNLITTVAPTNFATEAGLLHRWIGGLDVDRLVDAYGNIPGAMLNTIFLMLNPMRLMVDKYVTFTEQCADQGFVENFLRMEKWIFDSPAIPGETFRQFAKDCYQRNLLIQNKMVIDGHPINLANITMPLLNIYARHDHLVPPAACSMLPQKVGGRDVENVCLDCGHIGIYVSRKSQNLLTPKIAAWLAQRDRPVSDL